MKPANFFKSQSISETKKFGRRLGSFLQAGDVLAIVGEFGAGKTTLVKGITDGLQVASKENVSSPSFVMIHEYQGREKVYHLDWYRLDSVKEMDAALFEQCFGEEAVSLVEWADRARRLLPDQHLWIELKHLSPKTRQIQITPRGKRFEEILRKL